MGIVMQEKTRNMSHEEEEEEISNNSMELELTSLTIQLLSLTQDLVNAKLRMETTAKSGWILLAKARYVSPGGPTSISRLQLPTEESDKDVVAIKRVHTEECIQEETKVRYFHHSFEDKAAAPIDSGVKQRKNVDKKESAEEKTANTKEQNPLKWFGVLTPPALKQAQAHFVSATEIAVDCANIQAEMVGVQNRIKYLQRIKLKAEKEKNGQIENLDSQFATNLSIVH